MTGRSDVFGSMGMSRFIYLVDAFISTVVFKKTKKYLVLVRITIEDSCVLGTTRKVNYGDQK